MNSHDRKQPRSVHLHPKPSGSSITIATPPRAALPSRHSSRASEHQNQTGTERGATSESNTPTTNSSPEAGGSELPRQQEPLTSTRNTTAGKTSTQNGASSSSQASSSSLSLTEKDKTARIAALEREISIMTSKFAAELDRQSAKIISESEASQFWQQKHSALHQQFLKSDTDVRVLRYELAAREERDRDIKTRVSSLLADRDTLREAWQGAKGELRRKEAEVNGLRAQVKGLKDFVSANSRTEGQVTDEILGEMVRGLGNGLQNWVILNFRRAKIDISKARNETKEQLLSFLPTYETELATSKVHFIQSLVSRLLVTYVFDCYFVGLPEQRAKEIQSLDGYLQSYSQDVAVINGWRSSTLAIFKKSPDELRDTTEAVTDNIISTVNNIMDDVSDIRRSENRDQSLRVLINNAIELSRLLRVQKAVLRTFMPVIEGHQINTFDAEIMEDIGGEDETTLAGREIRCVTFPGIVKEGDERGEHVQLRNVISKARVLCSHD